MKAEIKAREEENQRDRTELKEENQKDRAEFKAEMQALTQAHTVTLNQILAEINANKQSS